MELNIGIVATTCSIIFGFLGYWRGTKAEVKQEGSLITDIAYIKQSISELLSEQKAVNQTASILNNRLTIVEMKVDSAHSRLDNVVVDFKDCRKENVK